MSDITIAASEDAFAELFAAIRDNFHFAQSDSASFGPFSASYSVAVHLEGGSVALNADDTVEVKHVKIVWDSLSVGVCLNIPGWCVPGFCVVPDPWNGCLVGFPGFCIGGGRVCAPLDLSGLVSEITDIKAGLVTDYHVDPARPPGLSDLQAELNGYPNTWRVFLNPSFVAISPIDVPASVAGILENLVKDAIDSLIPSWVPGWAKDLLWDLIGPILALVKKSLGVVGDLTDWLGDLLLNQFNLLFLLETAVTQYFASENPIPLLPDPYPVLPAAPGLIPVTIPVRNLAAHVTDVEMIVTADIGA